MVGIETESRGGKGKVGMTLMKQFCPNSHWEIVKDMKKCPVYCTREDKRKSGTEPVMWGYDKI